MATLDIVFGRKKTVGSIGGSLRKHPFLLALRQWGRFARRNVCEMSPAAKSEEKLMFSQAPLAVTFEKMRLDILYTLGGVLFSRFHSGYLYSFIFGI